MALITMAVYDTEDNGRLKYTKETLTSLAETNDFLEHGLLIVNNNSCRSSRIFMERFVDQHPGTEIINLPENVGTARAINYGIKRRGERAIIKMDNDVIIKEKDWATQMEIVADRLPGVGIVGLKRNDLEQSPSSSNSFYKTSLHFLPKARNEKWTVVEQSVDIIGTCTLFTTQLLQKVGYMRQPGLYGFDDAIMSHISIYAGFKNYFLPTIEIDHIDTEANPYIKEKQRLADEAWDEFQYLMRGYKTGKIPLYAEFEGSSSL